MDMSDLEAQLKAADEGGARIKLIATGEQARQTTTASCRQFQTAISYATAAISYATAVFMCVPGCKQLRSEIAHHSFKVAATHSYRKECWDVSVAHICCCCRCCCAPLPLPVSCWSSLDGVFSMVRRVLGGAMCRQVVNRENT